MFHSAPVHDGRSGPGSYPVCDPPGKAQGKVISLDPSRHAASDPVRLRRERSNGPIRQMVKISDEEIDFLWNIPEEGAQKLLREYGVSGMRRRVPGPCAGGD